MGSKTSHQSQNSEEKLYKSEKVLFCRIRRLDHFEKQTTNFSVKECRVNIIQDRQR